MDENTLVTGALGAYTRETGVPSESYRSGPVPAGGDDSQKLRLRSVSCPNCAGALAVRDGERLVSCERCGSRFLTASPGGFARRYFPNRVERLEAVGRATRWLLDHPDMSSDIQQSAFVEAHLLYVPIWEVRAYVVGWEFGQKTRSRLRTITGTDQECATVEMVIEGVHEGFLGERRFYQAAADLDTLGMGRPHVTGRDFSVPFVPGELEKGAAVLTADRDLEEVAARARKSFLRPPSGTSGRGGRLFLVRESHALLYYPLWSLKYRYHGRLYEMALDGRSGVVHAARGPAEQAGKLALLLASYAALALGIAIAVSNWNVAEATQQASFYVLLFVLAVSGGAFWKFRLVREVEYHEPFAS